MDIEKFLRIEKGKVYLKTTNGLWKKFDNILKNIQSEKVIKLKKKRFRVNGKLAWGGRNMGKDGGEIWIYAKLSTEEIEKTLIYEIAGLHYEDAGIIKIRENGKFLEEIAQKIWQDENCRLMVKDVLINLNL